jgi:hypothetical protein
MRLSFVCLLVFNMLASIAAESPAQAPTPESTARQRFNQVFVKVIVPVTADTPKQDGPVVESWVAEQLNRMGQMGESEYFAVTDWVPVCDGLLADNIINNDVWNGRLNGTHRYCPVAGDIPERENGRLIVRVGGWLPFGVEVNIGLPDEPGSRAVRAVQIVAGKEQKPVKVDKRLPFVAVIIAPPPRQAVASSHGNAK